MAEQCKPGHDEAAGSKLSGLIGLIIGFSRLSGVFVTRGPGCAFCRRSGPTSRDKCAWSDPPTQQERFHFVFLVLFYLFFLQFSSLFVKPIHLQ